jgi:hypothetical protein
MASIPILLDWTAERLQAWSLASGAPPKALTLDGHELELPLVLSMAERRLQMGLAARKLVRSQPHQVVDNFLPYLGIDRFWQYGRHRLDARDAVQWILQKLKDKLPGKSLFHTVPSYWNREQAAILEDITRQAGYRSLGVMKRGLALGGTSPGLVLDVDSHAFTLCLTKLQARTGNLQLEKTQTSTDLALHIWTERIGMLIAAKCLKDSRRDPRAHAETDQQLYEQVGQKLTEWASQQDVRLSLQLRDWQEELLLPASEVATVCMPLAQRCSQLVAPLQEANSWYLSSEASRLPGLPQAMYQHSMNQRALSVLPESTLPQTLMTWIQRIEQGHSSASSFSDVLPVVEAVQEPQADTLPFPRRTGKR